MAKGIAPAGAKHSTVAISAGSGVTGLDIELGPSALRKDKKLTSGNRKKSRSGGEGEGKWKR